MGNYDVNFESDNHYLNNLGGRTFMAAVSPWFFTVCSRVLLCFQVSNSRLTSALWPGII